MGQYRYEMHVHIFHNYKLIKHFADLGWDCYRAPILSGTPTIYNNSKWICTYIGKKIARFKNHEVLTVHSYLEYLLKNNPNTILKQLVDLKTQRDILNEIANFLNNLYTSIKTLNNNPYAKDIIIERLTHTFETTVKRLRNLLNTSYMEATLFISHLIEKFQGPLGDSIMEFCELARETAIELRICGQGFHAAHPLSTIYIFQKYNNFISQMFQNCKIYAHVISEIEHRSKDARPLFRYLYQNIEIPIQKALMIQAYSPLYQNELTLSFLIANELQKRSNI